MQSDIKLNATAAKTVARVSRAESEKHDSENITAIIARHSLDFVNVAKIG